jgi:hypothetical protein
VQFGKYLEKLRGFDNPHVFVFVIRADLTEADPLETSRLRDRKRLHNLRSDEVIAGLAPINFGPRNPVVRPFDWSVLQAGISPDRAMCWFDPEGFELRRRLRLENDRREARWTV